MNDGISKDLASLSYVSVDEVLAGIIQQGRGKLLSPFTQATDLTWHAMAGGDICRCDATFWAASLIFSVIAKALQGAMERMGIE